MRVILLSRYGMRDFDCEMASTHCARTKSDLLIADDSTSLSLLFSVLLLSSEPAKSMALTVLARTWSPVVWLTLTQRTACDREECAFNFVAEVDRLTFAWSYSCSNSFSEVHGLSVKPTTIAFPFSLSRIGRPAGVRLSGASNRSKTLSL